jgi:putative intracellular protease/amidase
MKRTRVAAALGILLVAAYALPVAAKERKRAAILVFPGVQIIDFTAPYEVLGQAGLEVVTVAETTAPIATAMGLRITPQFTLDAAPDVNVIVVPGGDVLATQESAAVKSWLNARAPKAEVVLSVCNGAFILAKAGLLDGLSATTFAALIDGLRAAAPKTKVVSDKRFVDNGKIVTSAGLSSGIDGSLHVVEKLYGRGAAQKVAINLEYNWDPEGRWVRAQLADRLLLSLYRAANDWDRDILLHDGTSDAWENRWRVRTERSGSELVASVAAALGVAAKEAKGTPGTSASTWTFTDEKGRAWRGSASAAPDPKSPGSILLTVQIERPKGA